MNRLKCTLALSLVLMLGACGGGNAVKEGLTGRVTQEGYEGKMVYLETTGSHPARIDSALVKDGAFTLPMNDSVPMVYQLVLAKSADDMFPIMLPVVSEKGAIKVTMGEYVLTSGTPMNDSLQDFLLAVSNFSDKAMKEESLDMAKLREDFSGLLEGAIMQNIQTPVGVYIYRMYADRLSDAQRETILSRADNRFKEAVKQ